MRVVIDMTNSPHVPFFAPLAQLLEGGGHEVHLVARRFAQTVELAQMHGLEVTVLGAHGGTSRIGKGTAAALRTLELGGHVRRIARRHGPVDVALSHGSTDLPLVSRLMRIPHVTIFDYEWARTMHHLNCRASWRVLVPDAIPIERLEQYGAAGKVSTYPGLKEEYYLDAEALDQGIRAELDIPEAATLLVLRPPADMALYHRGISNDVFGEVLTRARGDASVYTVVLARTGEQRERLAQHVEGDPRVRLPAHALDGPSLIAAADVVVSAGGTMNREAAALGVPVFTIFAGQMGGVDEQLIATGRLRQLADAGDVDLAPRAGRGMAPDALLRDPRDLLGIILDGLPVPARSVAP